jgi:hypothetical protein
VLVPHSPSTINDLFAQFRDTMVTATAMSAAPIDPTATRK